MTLSVKNIKTNTFHILDVIESYGDVTVVFTKDSKCFNINDVKILNNVERYLYVETIELTDAEMDEDI
jgi:hypothetical protein